MIDYCNTLERIEHLRIESLPQGYGFINERLERAKQQYNISNFGEWDKWSLNNIGFDTNSYNAELYIKESYLYSLFVAKETIDKINSGISIRDISFVSVISMPCIPYSQLKDSWWAEIATIECPLWALEMIETAYDLHILFWIINGVDATYHLQIVDKLIWELLLVQDSQYNAVNHVCTLEYLLKYKKLLQSNSTQTSAPQLPEQEQIYSIPTNLTEAQLKSIFVKLKEEAFIAPEQTEEDFLNSFAIEGRKAAKQGKIKWIKRGKKQKDNISRTVVLEFVKFVGKGLFAEDKERIIEAVFSIQPRPEEFTRVKADEYKSEYHNELQQMIAK